MYFRRCDHYSPSASELSEVVIADHVVDRVPDDLRAKCLSKEELMEIVISRPPHEIIWLMEGVREHIQVITSLPNHICRSRDIEVPSHSMRTLVPDMIHGMQGPDIFESNSDDEQKQSSAPEVKVVKSPKSKKRTSKQASPLNRGITANNLGSITENPLPPLEDERRYEDMEKLVSDDVKRPLSTSQSISQKYLNFTIKELKHMALGKGIAPSVIEECDGHTDTKDAIIELLISQTPTKNQIQDGRVHESSQEDGRVHDSSRAEVKPRSAIVDPTRSDDGTHKKRSPDEKEPGRAYRFSQAEVNLRDAILDPGRTADDAAVSQQFMQDNRVMKVHEELKVKVRNSERAHLAAQKYYEKIYYALMTATILLSTVVSFIAAAQDPIGLSEGAMKVLVAGFSSLNGFSTGLLGLLKAQSRMDAHGHAAEHYRKLYTSLEMTVFALSAARFDAENFLERIDAYKTKIQEANNMCQFPPPGRITKKYEHGQKFEPEHDGIGAKIRHSLGMKHKESKQNVGSTE